jgi:hypothetical protein
MALKNVYILPHHYNVSQPRSPQYASSSLWKSQVSQPKLNFNNFSVDPQISSKSNHYFLGWNLKTNRQPTDYAFILCNLIKECIKISTELLLCMVRSEWICIFIKSEPLLFVKGECSHILEVIVTRCGKCYPCLSIPQRHVYAGSGHTIIHILNLDTRWRLYSQLHAPAA